MKVTSIIFVLVASAVAVMGYPIVQVRPFIYIATVKNRFLTVLWVLLGPGRGRKGERRGLDALQPLLVRAKVQRSEGHRACSAFYGPPTTSSPPVFVLPIALCDHVLTILHALLYHLASFQPAAEVSKQSFRRPASTNCTPHCQFLDTSEIPFWERQIIKERNDSAPDYNPQEWRRHDETQQ